MLGLRGACSTWLEAPSERSVERMLTTLHLAGHARSALVSLEQLLVQCRRLPVVGRFADAQLAAIHRRLRHVFGPDELLRVCAALDEEEVRYFVGGGWGLDLLAGCQTRLHGDLDLCLEDFDRDLPAVERVLARLGYHVLPAFPGGVWFPDVAVHEDGRGHHIEVLSVNWPVLDAARRLFATDADSTAEPSATAANGSSPSVPRCTALGSIAGTTLRTFSIPAQRLFHLGYGHLEDRPEDVLAEDVLAALSARPGAPVVVPGRLDEQAGDPPFVPATLLLVPIFSLPYGLWRLCKQFGNDFDAIPPHVTVAYPFLPAHRVDATVLDELARIFAGHEPFDFDLASLGWFGDDVVYLEPPRPERFTTMTAALQQSFPDFRPYDGAFDAVVPQVTLSAHETATREERRALATLGRRYLPVAARATHVWLMSNKRHPDHWSIERFFPLGAAATGRATT